MKLTFKTLFIKIQIVEIPEKLCSFVVERIAAHERMMAKRKAIIEGIISVASFAGIVSIFNLVIQSFTQSGFYQYAEILFSGDSAVLSLWKEISLSLMESLPVFSLLVLFSAIVICLWAGVRAAQNVKVVMSSSLA